MEPAVVDLADELVSKPLFPGSIEPTVFPPQVFKILGLLLAILVVLVVVVWYHCGDEILTFLDLDQAASGQQLQDERGDSVDLDMTSMEMDQQLTGLMAHLKAGTQSGRGISANKAGGRKTGGGRSQQKAVEQASSAPTSPR